MRTGQRLAVPRGGIRPISVVSSTYIRATMAAPRIVASSSTWRADLRAASARRECDGRRTSCAADVLTRMKSCEK
jgi:hypothetical protein